MDGNEFNTKNRRETLLTAPFGQAADLLSDVDDETLKDFILSRIAHVHWNIDSPQTQTKLSEDASHPAYGILHDWTYAMIEAWRRSPKPGSCLNTLLSPHLMERLDGQLNLQTATSETQTLVPYGLNDWVADHLPPYCDDRELHQKVSDETLRHVVDVQGTLNPQPNLAAVSDHTLAWAIIKKADAAFHGPFESETYALAFATGRHVAMRSIDALRDFQTLLHEMARRGEPPVASPLARVWQAIDGVPENNKDDIGVLAQHVSMLAPLKPQAALTADEARLWNKSQCPKFT